MTMASNELKFHFGWTGNLEVPDAIALVQEQGWDGSVLITVLDSSAHVSRSPVVTRLIAEYPNLVGCVGDDVVMSISTLTQWNRRWNLLTGFDEIWLFEDPPRAGKSVSCVITSDVPLTSSPPDELLQWMESVGCRGGLGDGDGLNYVTDSAELATLWQRS